MAKANDWQYSCIDCGKLTMAGVDFAGSCPGCGGTRWLCHWIRNGAKEDFKAENKGCKLLDHMIRHSGNLSQVFINNTIRKFPENGKISNRPGPKPQPLGDLVSQLASQGLSSRMIAARLNELGINVSYKTIQRRLQRALL